MDGLVPLFGRAVEEFGRRMAAIRPEQWTAPTPDDEWDVRALANHMLVEDLWAPPLLEGLTIAQVGDRFDGDQLGDDPQGAWTRASEEAVAAVARPGVLDRTVHVSFGDISGREYVSQLLCDHVVHAWDLARAIGAGERLDPELVDFTFEFYEPQADALRMPGVFGPKVELPAGADRQSALLALTGRRP